MNKINTLIALTFLTFNLQAQEAPKTEVPKAPLVKDISANDAKVKPFYQGEAIKVEHGGAYTYLEVKEHSEKTFWIAVTNSDVKKGDYIRFKKELVTKKFKSKALNRTFDEIMFASNLQHKVSK